MNSSRRELLARSATVCLAAVLPVRLQASALVRKTIPSSGEAIPAIGLGTARRYQDASSKSELAPSRQ